MSIFFYRENCKFQFFKKRIIKNWISYSINEEGFKTGNINIIFTSTSDIIDINVKYLNHNYPTDIITFNYSKDLIISGELFICPDIVKENALEYSDNNFALELYRVLIHGILHLIGYDDKSKFDTSIMRNKEDYYLQKLYSFNIIN